LEEREAAGNNKISNQPSTPCPFFLARNNCNLTVATSLDVKKYNFWIFEMAISIWIERLLCVGTKTILAIFNFGPISD
jgi:hypothetical protein